MHAGGGAVLLGEGVTADLDAELDEAAAVELEKMKAQFRPEDLVGQYAIKGGLFVSVLFLFHVNVQKVFFISISISILWEVGRGRGGSKRLGSQGGWRGGHIAHL
jgi:hypothetical protein